MEVILKILYIECMMGAAGDMLMGALLELISDKQSFIDKMNMLMPGSVEVKASPCVKCGITGTHVNVTVNGIEEKSEDITGRVTENESTSEHESGHEHGHHHEHVENDGHESGHGHDDGHGHEHGHHHGYSMQDIKSILQGMDISQKVIDDALAVYGIIAEAESAVHGKSVDEIHFHEVGNKDAIADIVGCCILFEEIGADKIIVSPVTTGFGQVRCAHGILPVPAPATAFILKGIPARSGVIEGELCTPTGAALLKYFADEFASMPVMTADRIGYGMGSKDFEAANCVRAIYGASDIQDDYVVELCCNLDDMTAEDIGYASETMMREGALDVYTTAIGMKKSRPGTMFTVMCSENDKDRMTELIFKHTTTIGVREYYCRRTTLERSFGIADTTYGPVRYKKSKGFGVVRRKIEYEDLKEISLKTGMSFDDIRREAFKCMEKEEN